MPQSSSSTPQGRRRPADRGPRPPGPGPAGRLRRLRRLGSGRGRRQAHLLRPLRAAAPRPGVGRHRGQQRPPDPGLQGHGPGLAGLRRVHARVAQGPPRDRPRRYSTTGASTWQNAQPTFRPDRRRLDRARPQRQPDQHRRARARWSPTCPAPTASSTCTARPLEASTNDTGLVTALLAHHPDTSLEQRALEVLPQLRGAFCFVWMNEDTLYAARDPQGIRPLVLGRLDRGWVVASEDAALATIGASVVREVEPGEMIVIDENGLRSHTFAEPAPQGLRVRVRLPRPPRRHDQRPQRARGAGRDGPPAGPRVPGRRRPGHARCPSPAPRPPSGYAEESRHPVRPGLRQERLRRPHLHPAQPDAAPARHPAQAQRRSST